MPIRLALSLHAPEDALRSKIMPVNERYSIAEVLDGVRGLLRAPPAQGLRRVRDARGRQRLLRPGRPARASCSTRAIYKLNLIPYNPTESVYDGSSPRRDRRVPGRAGGARAARDRAPDPRPRHRRGLRAAGGEGLGLGAHPHPLRERRRPALSVDEREQQPVAGVAHPRARPEPDRDAAAAHRAAGGRVDDVATDEPHPDRGARREGDEADRARHTHAARSGRLGLAANRGVAPGRAARAGRALRAAGPGRAAGTAGARGAVGALRALGPVSAAAPCGPVPPAGPAARLRRRDRPDRRRRPGPRARCRRPDRPDRCRPPDRPDRCRAGPAAGAPPARLVDPSRPGRRARSAAGPVGPAGPVPPVGPAGPVSPVGPAGPGAGAMPVPVNLTVCVPAIVLSSRRTAAARAPSALGANRMRSVHCPAGGTLAPVQPSNVLMKSSG